ncbi:galactokinase [Streptomyces sp. LE64]|uniref:galactokinase n=1 Tax=Streptomyces sp. LE64 TaxID=3448653 RepID=UPI004041D5DA
MTPAPAVDTLTHAFERLYGRAPAGVWAAPGRVNLIGEYTDFNEGFVMPLALPHTVVLAAAPRTDGVLRLHSANAPDPAAVVDLRTADLAPGAGAGWTAYPAGVLWALADAGHPAVLAGADLHLESTVPTGAGLSSSAALEVATAVALDEVYGLGLDRPALARLAQRAENAYVGVPCGIMDQMASACGAAGHVLHLDCRDLGVRPIPFDPAAHGLRLLVVDTGVQHALGDGAYAERRAGCERGARELGVPHLRDVPHEALPDALARLGDERLRRYVRHVVEEDHRVGRVADLLAESTPEALRAVGPVLTAGHRSLRDDLRVSCPELDLVVSTANAAGALGARMTGGGFGGSAVVLTDAAEAPRVAEAVRTAFARAGFAPPTTFDATPSEGARRLA